MPQACSPPLLACPLTTMSQSTLGQTHSEQDEWADLREEAKELLREPMDEGNAAVVARLCKVAEILVRVRFLEYLFLC